MSSGLFDCTEPSLTTSLQGKQGVQGAYALVRGGVNAFTLHMQCSVSLDVMECQTLAGFNSFLQSISILTNQISSRFSCVHHIPCSVHVHSDKSEVN